MIDNGASAAFIIIGNEILSGRTQDTNLQFLGSRLAERGINLAEVRVVADETDAIGNAVNDLRQRYRYVFTSGGIGPTHDDITTASIARAFAVTVVRDPGAVARLRAYYGDARLSDARLRMADIPDGAVLIDNPVSAAPGFRIENVHVFAGVPRILQAMFDAIAHTLDGGPPIRSRSVAVRVPESVIADALARVQQTHVDVAIGSYPFARGDAVGTTLVVRSADADALASAFAAVQHMLGECGAEAYAPE